MMLDGWAGLEEIGKVGDEPPDPDAPDSGDLVDALFVAALNNPAGMKLLYHWKQRYLDQPVCVPGAGAEVGFHREGQNSVIREAIMRLTRGLKPKT